MLETLHYVEIFVSILLIFAILIQNKSVSLNLTSMSGGMNQIKKRGPEKFLHNATIFLGIVFILNSMALFIL